MNARRNRRGPPKCSPRGWASTSATSERCVDESLALLTPNERRLITESASFPDLDEALMTAAGYADAGQQLASLRANIPQAFERREDTLQDKTLFADVLRDRLAASGIEAVSAAHARTGHALASCDRIVEALAYYIHGREFAAIAQLIESRGLAFVEAGYGDTIQEAIEALDPIARTGSPVILAIKATFESRLGRFDTAESWFQLALDRAADAGVRNQIAYQYGTHLLRFQRPEAIGLLEVLAADTAAGADLRCYARSALGPAYVFARRPAAVTCGPEFSTKRPTSRCSVTTVRARRCWRRIIGDRAAGWILRYCRRCVNRALQRRLGPRGRPDPKLTIARRDCDCAAKSGSLTNHLLALIYKLEIEVERGDEDAIELDVKPRTIDARCGGRATYEALIASQALRAGWTGDYAGAYHLLLPSAEQQGRTRGPPPQRRQLHLARPDQPNVSIDQDDPPNNRRSIRRRWAASAPAA